MSVYTVKFDSDYLNPMSEMTNRSIRRWRGMKNKTLNARHITDGTIMIDKKHVKNDELFGELTDRRDDEDIDNDEVKDLVSHLKKEDQWVGKVRGQAEREEFPGMGDLRPTWVAVVGYRNYRNHCLADGQAIQTMTRLFGESPDLKVGKSEILTWWKYGVPIGAVATWDFFGTDIK